MTIQEIRAAYEVKPFKPFAILLTDGRTVPVSSPDVIWVPPVPRTFVVYHEDAYHFLDLRLVTSLEFQRGERRR
jgi:hypothetical protein